MDGLSDGTFFTAGSSHRRQLALPAARTADPPSCVTMRSCEVRVSGKVLKTLKDTHRLKLDSGSVPTASPVQGLRRRCFMYSVPCVCVCKGIHALFS